MKEDDVLISEELAELKDVIKEEDKSMIAYHRKYCYAFESFCKTAYHTFTQRNEQGKWLSSTFMTTIIEQFTYCPRCGEELRKGYEEQKEGLK